MSQEESPASPPPAQEPSAPKSPAQEPLGPRGVPWSVIDAVVVYVLVLLPMLLVVLVLDEVAPGAGRRLGFSAGLLVLALFTVLYVRARFPGSTAALLGPRLDALGRRTRWWRDLAAGALHGVAGFLVINLGVALIVQLVADTIGVELPQPQEALRDSLRSRDTALTAILGAVLLAPVAEELFFRGMLFQALRRRLWLWPAVGWSAVLFAVGHVQVGDLVATLLVFLIIFPFGFYMAVVFARRGTLLAPIAMHAAFNGLGVLAILSGLA